MENQKNNYINHAIKYGIILGIIRALLDVALKVFDVGGITYTSSSFLGFAIEIIVIVIAVKVFRDVVNNGKILLNQAVKIGVIMMIFTATIYFVVSTFFMPEFAEVKILEVTAEHQPEMYDELLDKFEEAREHPKHMLNFGTTLLWFSFIGAVISLIAGTILKRKQDDLY